MILSESLVNFSLSECREKIIIKIFIFIFFLFYTFSRKKRQNKSIM